MTFATKRGLAKLPAEAVARQRAAPLRLALLVWALVIVLQSESSAENRRGKLRGHGHEENGLNETMAQNQTSPGPDVAAASNKDESEEDQGPFAGFQSELASRIASLESLLGDLPAPPTAFPKNLSGTFYGQWQFDEAESPSPFETSDWLKILRVQSAIEVNPEYKPEPERETEALPFRSLKGDVELRLDLLKTQVPGVQYASGTIGLVDGQVRSNRDVYTHVAGFYLEQRGALTLYFNSPGYKSPHVGIDFAPSSDATAPKAIEYFASPRQDLIKALAPSETERGTEHSNAKGADDPEESDSTDDASLAETSVSNGNDPAVVNDDANEENGTGHEKVIDFDPFKSKPVSSGNDKSDSQADKVVGADKDPKAMEADSQLALQEDPVAKMLHLLDAEDSTEAHLPGSSWVRLWDTELGLSKSQIQRKARPNSLYGEMPPCFLRLELQVQSSAAPNGDQVQTASAPPSSRFRKTEVHGIASSSSCEYARLVVNLNTMGEDIGQLLSKASDYFSLDLPLTVVAALAVVTQHVHTRALPRAATVSLLTVGSLAILDGCLALAYLSSGLLVEKLGASAIFVAFAKSLLVTLLDMRYLMHIWRGRHPQTAWDTWAEMQRLQTMLHRRFYASLLGAVALAFLLADFHRLLWFVALSFWVPQIYCNIKTNSASQVNVFFVFGVSLPHLFAPLYIYACPRNFLTLLLTSSTIGHSPIFACFLAFWMFLQITALMLQRFVSPHIFVPARFLPPKYDYNRKIPERLRDTQCAICLLTVTGVDEEHMITPCNHLFHRDCLRVWINEKLECPTCRAVLPPIEDVQLKAVAALMAVHAVGVALRAVRLRNFVTDATSAIASSATMDASSRGIFKDYDDFDRVFDRSQLRGRRKDLTHRKAAFLLYLFLSTTEDEVIVHVDWSKLVQEKTNFACRKELRLCSRVEKLVGPSVMEAWDKVLERLYDLAEDIAHGAKVEDEETNVAHELCREFRECGFAATWRANRVLKISWYRDGVPTRSDEIIGTISSSLIKHRKFSRARLSTSHSGVSCTFECKAGSVYTPQHLKWDNAGEVLAQYMSMQKWNSVLANLVALADGIRQKKTLALVVATVI
ncbi:Transmembrane E3 ubiquitin-protein ligase 1 [Hondaea fermentalgiana]|uniref:RING-type E3 ubiquitin transferase n=1 Tax=Hondaea fermentalgiana TaxID=2315210 RepID=A0A2R5GSB0_9STRA|nr:Transmembrane E3 ubiquitin-protein ligase 1 [Hondaea fermentalgiana]|eukprot:GBG30764.1 Transmembrane E3 ubiquitin-protein ligase 1 [Hondaea fermentalgiana]